MIYVFCSKMIKQVVDDKAERRRGRQKIEERNQIVKKVHSTSIFVFKITTI